MGLQRLWRKVSNLKTIRTALIANKFNKEIDYLTWYFKREYKETSSTKEKKVINNYIARLTDGRDNEDIIHNMVITLQKFSDLCKAEYMLDYSLWMYYSLHRKIQKY